MPILEFHGRPTPTAELFRQLVSIRNCPAHEGYRDNFERSLKVFTDKGLGRTLPSIQCLICMKNVKGATRIL